MFRIFSFLAVLMLLSYKLQGQDEELTKNVQENVQTWISTNNVYQISDKWAALTDIHIRRTDFVKNPSFYFLRLGAQYSIKPNIRLAAGYAHLWLAQSENWSAYRNENRVYQQMSLTHAFEKLNTLFRVRNEQRFFNDVKDGQSLDNTFFINRFRLLLSIGIPFKKGGKTQLLIADEIHLNFGKEVVFNTFDQNRFTIGIKQKLSETWSMDCGYMLVFQQLSTGIDYNLNHTLRLFFYGRFDFRKTKKTKLDPIQHGEE